MAKKCYKSNIKKVISYEFYSRANKDYWQNLNPSTGRPYSASCSRPDNWGITQGTLMLKSTSDKKGI